MTAKKKTHKMTRGERAAMVIDRWAGMELELAETKKKLAYANELLAVADALMKKGQESMRERVGALVESAEALAAKNKELDELQKKLAAETRELEFWVEESDRYRDKVVALLRQQAVEQAKLRAGS